MMRLISSTFPGNIRRYDASAVANPNMVRLNFRKLQVDPYVPEGFRRKHIVRYRVLEKEDRTGQPVLELLPPAPLYQRTDVNPVHGGLTRVYPMLRPTADTLNVVRAFVRESSVAVDDCVLVQAQRVTCTLEQGGLPSVEGWHRDDVTEMGIYCVSRRGIRGGTNQFSAQPERGRVLDVVLRVGEMVVFEDAPLLHRVTPIRVAPGAPRGCGYRDVLLMSYGGSSSSQGVQGVKA